MGAVLVGSAVIGVVESGDDADEDAAEFDESGQSTTQSTSIDPTEEPAVLGEAGALNPTEPDGGSTQTGTIGADLLDGGAGDDILQGYEGDDQITAYEGDDVAFGEAGNDTIHGGAGADSLFGEADDDRLEGGAGDDALWGGAGNDALLGGAGEDRLTGGDGADTLLGGDDADQLEGGLGDDVLFGGDGQDNLQGGTGNDRLAGDDDLGVDWLNGGPGDDILLLGDGDVATGGDGADLFRLGPDLVEETVAEIMDFEPGEDSLALLWDDIVSDAPPEITLGEANSDAVEVYADGELIGVVHGGSTLSPEDIQLVPMSASATV
ncbi:calcium-binding protein [Oceanicola sp. D3]|uniref:calcium-binding protein n=1 Tax=Oceanicola sp. D3 TaxID=2587163 RepID=UPI00143D0637|nr:calcium-binding protein [Oceanicola sp. D3]